MRVTFEFGDPVSYGNALNHIFFPCESNRKPNGFSITPGSRISYNPKEKTVEADMNEKPSILHESLEGLTAITHGGRDIFRKPPTLVHRKAAA